MSVVEDRVSAKRTLKKKKTGKAAKAKSAKSLADRMLAGDHAVDPADYAAWCRHLKSRKTVRPLHKVFKSEGAPLMWGLPDGLIGSGSQGGMRAGGDGQQLTAETRSLLNQLWKLTPRSATLDDSAKQQIAEAASEWLHDAGADLQLDTALTCLAWANALPALGSVLDAATWRQVFDRLISLATDATAGGYQPETLSTDLFGVELPLTLAYHFPEVKAVRALGNAGAEGLNDSLLERLDGAGLPPAAEIPRLRSWLAMWTRCIHLGLLAGVKVAKKPMEQFDWLVRQALRLTRHDQSQVFWPLGMKAGAELRSLMNSALQITDDPEDKALVALILDGEKVRDHRLPADPGYESEWSQFALLQPDWSPREPRLAVDFSQPQLHCEFSVKQTVLSQGEWTSIVHVDGRPLEVASAWESICWQEDDDVDYLELQCDLQDGWTLQRQFVFARQDYFLFMGDALLGPRAANIELGQQIPLLEGVRGTRTGETSECFLTCGGKKALVIPPALSEWTSARHLGVLDVEDGYLRQTVQHHGQAAYLPLFIDVHPRRLRQQLTWRQLTVGANLTKATRDEAVGYRIHVGPEQWLFYRSMRRAVRSVLGQNLLSDFLCARFLDDGDVDTIIEIEDDDE